MNRPARPVVSTFAAVAAVVALLLLLLLLERETEEIMFRCNNKL